MPRSLSSCVTGSFVIEDEVVKEEDNQREHVRTGAPISEEAPAFRAPPAALTVSYKVRK